MYLMKVVYIPNVNKKQLLECTYQKTKEQSNGNYKD